MGKLRGHVGANGENRDMGRAAGRGGVSWLSALGSALRTCLCPFSPCRAVGPGVGWELELGGWHSIACKPRRRSTHGRDLCLI